MRPTLFSAYGYIQFADSAHIQQKIAVINFARMDGEAGKPVRKNRVPF